MEQHELSKLWTWQYIVTILTTFLFFLSFQALMGGFPVFVTGLSGDPSKGGMMTTTFMLAAIVSRPFVGSLIEKFNMKAILLVALILGIVTIGISLGRETYSFLVGLRIVQGILFGFITTLLATMATNLIPIDRIGEGIGYFGMATSLGTTFGPMLAISILHSYSFSTLLVIIAFMTLLTVIGSIFIKNKQPEAEAKQAGMAEKSSFWSNAFSKKALLPGVLVCLFYITFSGTVNFIDGLGTENHLGGKVSLFFLIVAAMLVFTRPFSGRIYDRLGHKYLVYPASIFGVIGLIIMAFSHQLSVLFIAAIFYGIAYGVMQPTMQAWAVSRVGHAKAGTANAMTLNFMDLGMAIGAATLGHVASGVGYNMTFGLSSILVIALLVFYMFRKKEKQQILVENI
ncbi:MFS transporter [Bacillus sp. 1P06AnD]|uniref:MFS transporter n=1 Tax=Bacillus sp. 1P06AnD TaxID=3132208 RepID=UPI0039A0A953